MAIEEQNIDPNITNDTESSVNNLQDPENLFEIDNTPEIVQLNRNQLFKDYGMQEDVELVKDAFGTHPVKKVGFLGGIALGASRFGNKDVFNKGGVSAAIGSLGARIKNTVNYSSIEEAKKNPYWIEGKTMWAEGMGDAEVEFQFNAATADTMQPDMSFLGGIGYGVTDPLNAAITIGSVGVALTAPISVPVGAGIAAVAGRMAIVGAVEAAVAAGVTVGAEVAANTELERFNQDKNAREIAASAGEQAVYGAIGGAAAVGVGVVANKMFGKTSSEMILPDTVLDRRISKEIAPDVDPTQPLTITPESTKLLADNVDNAVKSIKEGKPVSIADTPEQKKLMGELQYTTLKDGKFERPTTLQYGDSGNLYMNVMGDATLDKGAVSVKTKYKIISAKELNTNLREKDLDISTPANKDSLLASRYLEDGSPILDINNQSVLGKDRIKMLKDEYKGYKDYRSSPYYAKLKELIDSEDGSLNKLETIENPVLVREIDENGVNQLYGYIKSMKDNKFPVGQNIQVNKTMERSLLSALGRRDIFDNLSNSANPAERGLAKAIAKDIKSIDSLTNYGLDTSRELAKALDPNTPMQQTTGISALWRQFFYKDFEGRVPRNPQEISDMLNRLSRSVNSKKRAGDSKRQAYEKLVDSMGDSLRTTLKGQELDGMLDVIRQVKTEAVEPPRVEVEVQNEIDRITVARESFDEVLNDTGLSKADYDSIITNTPELASLREGIVRKMQSPSPSPKPTQIFQKPEPPEIDPAILKMTDDELIEATALDLSLKNPPVNIRTILASNRFEATTAAQSTATVTNKVRTLLNKIPFLQRANKELADDVIGTIYYRAAAVRDEVLRKYVKYIPAGTTDYSLLKNEVAGRNIYKEIEEKLIKQLDEVELPETGAVYKNTPEYLKARDVIKTELKDSSSQIHKYITEVTRLAVDEARIYAGQVSKDFYTVGEFAKVRTAQGIDFYNRGITEMTAHSDNRITNGAAYDKNVRILKSIGAVTENPLQVAKKIQKSAREATIKVAKNYSSENHSNMLVNSQQLFDAFTRELRNIDPSISPRMQGAAAHYVFTDKAVTKNMLETIAKKNTRLVKDVIDCLIG